MADIENLGVAENENNSADDTSDSSTLAPWQKSLSLWQWPLTFGPFVLLIAVAQFPISNKIPTGLFIGLVMAAVVWAVAFKGYLLYLSHQN